MKNINIDLSLLSSVQERRKNIPPNQLSCSLCYNISFDGKVCNNRKCQKVFCGLCFKKLRYNFFDNDKKELKCPFCQTFTSFSPLDKDIIDFISSFKYYCNKSKNCKKEYTLFELINEHNHSNFRDIKKNKCDICKNTLLETNLDTTNCILCDKIGCFKNISYNPIKNNINKSNVINKKTLEYCMQKCFICKSPICKICCKDNNFIKNNISNFICDECKQTYKCDLCSSNNYAKNICIFCNKYLCESCSYKCEHCKYIFCKKDCLLKKLICDNCIDLNAKINYYSCFHLDFLNCSKCFKKCNLCKINNTAIQCRCCYKDICIKDCSVKCKNCKLICCNKCSLVCSICKKIICSNCANFCDECNKYDTLVSCKNCNCNIIRKCQYQKNGIYVCSTRLCISCWKACNYCGIIFCSKHSITCINCEDIVCKSHYKKCQKCLNKEELKYYKLCFKKCILKCSFCLNYSTVICKEINHQKDFVHNFGCKHNICNTCIKKCENCGKIVKKCLECIDYFYELCEYCQKYQCLSCCNKCNMCDETYCSLNHKCSFCSSTFPGKCYNCDIKVRNKCLVCKTKLKICELCKNKFICNIKCYKVYKSSLMHLSSNEHLCQMFLCKNHFNYDN